MKKYKQIRVMPDGHTINPDQTILECEAEGCTNDVVIGTSYSFVVTFATTGGHGVPAFQCEEEQHFCCSPACALNAAHTCIAGHLIPAHTAKVAKIVADSGASGV